MIRSDRWWRRELERREREWALERAELIATVCHLAGRPLRRNEQRPDLAKAEQSRPLVRFIPSPDQTLSLQ